MLRIGCLLLSVLALTSASMAGTPGQNDYRLLELDGRLVKWGSAELGAGAAVTYAFLDEAAEFADARNCRNMVPIDAIAREADFDRAAVEEQAAQAFGLWAALADISFTKTDDPASADILIGAELGARGSAHADLLAADGSGPIGALDRGLICLSASQPWKIGFGGAPQAQDLRYTFAHEIGHALGLNHPGPHGEIMSFTYSEDFSEPQPGDIAGAIALYGRRPAEAGAYASLDGVSAQ